MMKLFLKKIILLCSMSLTLIGAQEKQPSELYHIASTVKEFYFVRHGQTDHNAGIITAGLDLPLNECGRQQAVSIKSIISALPVKSVCYSPLIRAKETKNIIAAQLNVIEHEIADLSECSVEEWQEMNGLRKEGFAQANSSLQLFVEQVSRGIGISLLKATPVLIVAHGGVYYALCYLLDVATDDWKIDNCVPVHFYLDADGRWKVKNLKS